MHNEPAIEFPPLLLATAMVLTVIAGGLILTFGLQSSAGTASLIILAVLGFHSFIYSMAFVARKGWSKAGVL